MAGRQQYLAPIGRDQIGIGILGESVRGVTIDNPSGCWLLVLPEYDYVPPYTLGWSRSYVAGLANITVRWAGLTPAYPTPAGQVSTQQGDGATIVLTSEPVTDSAGTPQGGAEFIDQFTPTTTTNVNANAAVSTPLSNQIVIGAVSGKRYRVLGIELAYNILRDSPVRVHVHSTAGLTTVRHSLWLAGVSKPTDRWTGVLDFPVGSAIEYDITTDWIDAATLLVVTWQLI